MDETKIKREERDRRIPPSNIVTKIQKQILCCKLLYLKENQ